MRAVPTPSGGSFLAQVGRAGGAPRRPRAPGRAEAGRRTPACLLRAVLGALWVVLAAGLPALAAAAGPPAAPIRLALIEGLSGPFANAGEAVFRNLLWAVERVNARGGVPMPGGPRPLALIRYDSRGGPEEALTLLRAAIDDGARIVLQGNSSATATALVEAIDKHNARDPARRLVFLNYSAVEPSLTNERCSFWHFRFDAHADMRLEALLRVLRDDRTVERLYLIGQDYSFGRHVLARARARLAELRPDLQIVGEQLHPLGRVTDFAPYAAKIRASGAQAVLTGNWGNDLSLLVRAVRDAGAAPRFYTFYGNALGVPAAIGEAGVGAVLAVAEWHPNAGGAAGAAFYRAFRERFPDPRDDYLHARMQALVEVLAAALAAAGTEEAAALARALEGRRFDGHGLYGLPGLVLRADDHQAQQDLLVAVMQRAGGADVAHDVEGSGFGFRTVLQLPAAAVEQPHRCAMRRP